MEGEELPIRLLPLWRGAWTTNHAFRSISGRSLASRLSGSTV